ncbi:MAG TPA: helix-turn-helix domain-containing protein [Candidatus Baltobacteraceae bacterium]|jgi:DNA-binding transcriptional ArsR family regulator
MSTRVKRPSPADAIIHPERLELLTVIQLSGPLSARELREELPRISQASLYRHLKVLAQAGFIVTIERPPEGRGAPEKAFSTAPTAPSSIRLRGRERSTEALRRNLLALHAAEVALFERSAARRPIDAGDLSWRQSIVYLDRSELREVRAILARLKELETHRTDRQRAFALNVRLFRA